MNLLTKNDSVSLTVPAVQVTYSHPLCRLTRCRSVYNCTLRKRNILYVHQVLMAVTVKLLLGESMLYTSSTHNIHQPVTLYFFNVFYVYSTYLQFLSPYCDLHVDIAVTLGKAHISYRK